MAFFPAMMSRDSLDQWKEVVTFRFDDWHPAFVSFSYWLLSRIWFSPAIVCIAQMLALAAVFAYGMTKLQRRGLPLWGLVLITLFFSLLPLHGFYVNTLFKDVPFAITILLLFIYTIEIIESNGAWLASYRNIFYLSVSLALIWLFRHNGLLTSLLTLIGLFIFYFSYRKKIAIGALACLGLVYLVKGPLYDVIKVNGKVYALEIMLTHQIGAAIQAEVPLTAAEKQVIEQIMPLSVWKEKYNPFNSDGLVFNEYFNYQYLAQPEARQQYITTWFTLMKRNVPVLVEHQSKVSELVWRLDHQQESFTYAVHPLIDANDLGLKENSLLPSMKKLIMKVYNFTYARSFFRATIYRPAIYIYLSLLFIVASLWLLQDRRYLLATIPFVSIVAGIALTVPTQHVRYLYPCFLLAPFFGGYFLLYFDRYQARKAATRHITPTSTATNAA